ncbi:branched-chain amino acid ABC transporter permease [Micromonospora sp. NBC_01412]|uniref:branched-chain amino acid ABC transporter permease n=1 Tax=Micromonospora sp. NBC_01412 TaxID=2903590 RepID=UPI003253C43C
MTFASLTLRRPRPVLAVLSVVGLLVLVAAPFQLPPFRVNQITGVFIFALVLVGLNLVTGYAGIISLGHGAFFAVGAYTSAVLTHHASWPLLATLPVSLVVAAALGAVVGLPTLRLRGLYLALVTVALAMCAVPMFQRFEWLGGSQGLVVTADTPPFGLASDQWVYFVALVLAGAGFLVTRNIMRSDAGRALLAAKSNELAASTFGVDVSRFRTITFVISAGFAGLAGGVQTMMVGFASPESFPLMLSLTFFIGVVVGGVGSISGPLIGAFFVQYVPIWGGDINTSLSGLVFGAILILTILVAPGGIAGLAGRLARRVRAGRSVKTQSGLA